MEEILQQIEKVLQATEDGEKQACQDFKLFKSRLDCIVTGNKETSQTPQQKKKIKRLSIIIDGEEIDLNNPSSIVQESFENLENSNIRSSTASLRPIRAAKIKIESLKQPSLRNKMRRPSESNDSLSISKNVTKTNSKESINKVENDKSSKESTKRSFENDGPNENNKDGAQDESKKIDESLLIVPNGDITVVLLSEDETDRMMPPPNVIPKKKTNTKSKQSDVAEGSTRSSRLRIKKEKISLEKLTEKAEELVAKEKPEEIVKEIKDEKTEESSKGHSKKTKKGKKPIKCLPIKEEKTNESSEGTAKKSNEHGESRVTRNNEKRKITSMESVYEDAVADEAGNPTITTGERLVENTSINPVVVIEPINKPIPKTHECSEMPADATFISAKDTPNTETDTTFVTSAAQKTFLLDNIKPVDINNVTHDILDSNRTHIITTNQAGQVDATFCVNDETFNKQSAEQQNPNKEQQNNFIMRSSIMTEEDSGDELMPPPPPTSARPKSNKALFNPCIQSPVKKKVEAFEKHANAAASPLIPRQTRTKTKAKENTDPETSLINTKSNTPSLFKRDIGKLLTPTLQSNITPTIGGGLQLTKYLTSSTSKLAQIHKSSIKAPTINKTQSLSRENSVDDIRRGGHSKLQLAEEKKKNRELKQQQAREAREAKEKERADKLKKTLQEREDKMRRKAQEMEQKKRLEEINKNLKQQEEKSEAQKRMERKQLEVEMAEAARKEREMIDNMKVQKTKEELQQKLLQNQKIMEQKKAASKAGKQALKYDFHMLNSDDSTDDESKTNSKKLAPPVWSRSTIRPMLIERQSFVDTNTIDSLFSVQPMTPDLQEIFPAIDPRYLKRNSSVFWNTPPRYSQLPKY